MQQKKTQKTYNIIRNNNVRKGEYMKVIKRDGRAVDYDRNKIVTAIEKANKEVNSSNQATKEDIKGIITYIEELGKKRMLVEDIQDIIEEKLMELKKYELAKKYIVYRYTRALVRKQNTTDETILGIIRNENGEYSNGDKPMTVAAQRNFIASEVSRDLTKRLLLPEKIAKAEEERKVHFHNAEHFVHQMIDSSIINIADILENGTIINDRKIEPPSCFLTAIMITTQALAVNSNAQYGGQSVDMMHFGKYLRATYNKTKKQIAEECEANCAQIRTEERQNEKGQERKENVISEEKINQLAQNRTRAELQSGIQILQYQINTLSETNGKEPDITLFLHLEKDDEYIKENAEIIEEILKQISESEKIEDSKHQSLPKLVYVLDEINSLQGRRICKFNTISNTMYTSPERHKLHFSQKNERKLQRQYI